MIVTMMNLLCLDVTGTERGIAWTATASDPPSLPPPPPSLSSLSSLSPPSPSLPPSLPSSLCHRRWNLIKRVKLKKEEKEEDEEKKQKSSSGSASVLQIKLNKLAIQIGYGGTVAAIVCILVLTLKFVIGEFAIDERSWDSSTDYSELLHFVIIGITVLVVAVPEGLPLAVTIALAFSVKKMLKDNNLVR